MRRLVTSKKAPDRKISQSRRTAAGTLLHSGSSSVRVEQRMKIALAPSYRNWMLLLLPMTFGVGTAALWLFSLKWPLSVDEEGLILRDHRRVDWNSIRKIVVARNYLDGRISHVRIYHKDGVNEIRVNRLQHGEDVVRIVRAMFEIVNRSRAQPRVRTDASRETAKDLIVQTTERASWRC
jgi:hypothetical protein